jgi:hypothetical protein
MIKRIELIHHKASVWSKGNIYEDRTDMPEGKLLFGKNYPPKTPAQYIWADLRKQAFGAFFDIFYADVLERTGEPDMKTGKQSGYIQKRLTETPEFYEWNEEHEKYVMHRTAYETLTSSLGGGINIALQLPNKPRAEMVRELKAIGIPDAYLDKFRESLHYDATVIDFLQDAGKWEQISFMLFVYPDRYDQDLRAIIELKIYFQPNPPS